jgi:ribose transport system ATP-binding protein
MEKNHEDSRTSRTLEPPMSAPTGALVLEARNVSKSFFGVEVLHDVSLELTRGTVHGLVGENGAGKSTLMKIFAGVYERDSGSVLLDGNEVDYTHPIKAMRAGVATVFQEFNLLPDRTVAENVFLGREPRKAGFVDNRRMVRATDALLAELGIDFIDSNARVASLSVAEQQIVEITKALSFDARVISMDEPTAALADHEVELLHRIIERLKARGVAILYVSHRLREVFNLCDSVTVLKDGALVFTGPTTKLTPDSLVRMMVGRSISTFFPPALKGTAVGESRLTISGGGNAYIDDIDLEIKAGEIVGVAGLQGAGRTELAEAIFGAVPFTRGTMTLDGEPIVVKSIRRAVKKGLALITEDRKAQGLAVHQSVLDNTLQVIRGVFAFRTRAVRREVPGILSSLEISFRGLGQEVQFLSGGNQQKVVLTKWLATKPRVVILDEPTRGIDVGAKVAVYTLMRELAKSGVAILMVSSELPEVIGMSDRILVMHDGRITAELERGSSEEQILSAATGAMSTLEGLA